MPSLEGTIDMGIVTNAVDLKSLAIKCVMRAYIDLI